MSVALVALLLAPYLVEAGPMRLVSDGTGDLPVTWLLDGIEIANTTDGNPVVIDMAAGSQSLWAVTAFQEEWQVLARPEPQGPGVTYVTAWTARHEPEPIQEEPPRWWLPAGLAAVGAALLAWPSRSKNP
jgi:hypothetical protein